MINKDLNLSLNQNLIKPERVSGTSNTTATRNSLNSSISIAPPPSSTSNPQIQTLKDKVSLRQMLIGVVVTNAVFLLLAGISLTESFERNSISDRIYPETESITKVALVEFGDQIATLQKQLAGQGDALQQQLHDFQLVLRVDQQQLVSGYLDMTEHLQSAINQPQKITQPASPQASAITSLNKWYVNIGTFVNTNAAIGLQQKIVNLGYPATISRLTLDGKIAQRVQVAGFADRASAEDVAQKIMDTTKLNGLWAWKGK